jgi:hypothetical protein
MYIPILLLAFDIMHFSINFLCPIGLSCCRRRVKSGEFLILQLLTIVSNLAATY